MLKIGRLMDGIKLQLPEPPLNRLSSSAEAEPALAVKLMLGKKRLWLCQYWRLLPISHVLLLLNRAVVATNLMADRLVIQAIVAVCSVADPATSLLDT